MATSLLANPATAQLRTYVGQNGLSYFTYPASYPKGPAKIGINYNLDMMQKDGLYCYTVTSVEPGSAFTALHPGDCIYSLGTSYFRASSDLDAFISAFPVGTQVAINFFNSTRGWARWTQTAPLVARAAPQSNYSYAPPPPPSYQQVANLNQRIEAVILQDEPGWWSTYDRGSVSGSYIRWRSTDSRTVIARAYYSYGNGTRDWVDVKTTDGQFVCLEYGSTGGGCRPIYRKGSDSNATALIVAGLALAVVALAANSGGSGGGSSSYGGGGGDDDGGSRTRTPSPSPTPSPAPRSYGLYGDCPQPGAGYGC